MTIFIYRYEDHEDYLTWFRGEYYGRDYEELTEEEFNLLKEILE